MELVGDTLEKTFLKKTYPTSCQKGIKLATQKSKDETGVETVGKSQKG